MLLGQQRGGYQDCDLFPPGNGCKGSAQGDFGLAEAYVAADQPIHRFTHAHIDQNGFNGGGLIGGFLEAKTFGKGFVIVVRPVERMAFACGTVRIQIQ